MKKDELKCANCNNKENCKKDQKSCYEYYYNKTKYSSIFLNKDKFIIITDDGEESNNTINLYHTLKKLNKKVQIMFTEEKITAKSNSISLKPITVKKSHNFYFVNGFPADCLLFSLFHRHRYQQEKIQYIFGVNEHNHFGYSNFVGSTTCLLLIAKLYKIPAFSISSEINLNEKDYLFFLPAISYFTFRNSEQKYLSFNIKNNSMDFFHYATIDNELKDKYDFVKTSRNKYYEITYTRKVENPKSGTDIFYQSKNENYVVEF